MSLFAIDALWIDKGTTAGAIFEDIAEIVANHFLCLVHILLATCSQRLVVINSTIKAAPIMREGVTKHSSFAKPIAVPMADRNLI